MGAVLVEEIPVWHDIENCGYRWVYSRSEKKPAFVTCPGCQLKIRLSKFRADGK